ncbi:MAG: hypothetical protein EXS14_00860 [Planctomycetes bacterium]|nr:hypothetical protein [Planctomycetota bacterium]
MNRTLILFRRELLALMAAPGTWVLVGLSWLWLGALYRWQVLPSAGHGDLQYMLWQGTLHAVNMQILFVPLLTMRCVSEEKRSGTIEMLVTAPVGDHEIILAKFAAAWVVNILLWGVLPLYSLIAQQTGGDPDWGPVFAACFALLGAGAVLTAIGVFASSLTQNQLLAAFIGLLLTFGFLYAPRLVPADWTWTQGVLASGDLLRQVEEAARGIIDVVAVTFQICMCALFLLFATRSLEVRKWA